MTRAQFRDRLARLLLKVLEDECGACVLADLLTAAATVYHRVHPTDEQLKAHGIGTADLQSVDPTYPHSKETLQ